MKSNKRNGISLIVLVITIIIMIILAGAIILSLSGTGLITNSIKGSFQSDIATMQEELGVYIANKITETKGKYTQDTLFASKDNLEENGAIAEGKNIKNVLASIDKKYLDEIEVINGKLVYVGDNVNKLKWANEILLGVKKELEENISETGSIIIEKSANLNLVNYRIYGRSEVSESGEIQSVGGNDINLFNRNIGKEQGLFKQTTGNVSSNGTYPNIYVYTIPVKANTYYTYVGRILNNVTYCMYDSNMNYLGVYGGHISSRNNITFLTTSNTAYVKVCAGKDSVENETVVMNEGLNIIDGIQPTKYSIQIQVVGKNLLRFSRQGNYTPGFGVTYAIKDNIVTMNGETSGESNSAHSDTCFSLKAGTYTFSYKYISGTMENTDQTYGYAHYLQLRDINNENIVSIGMTTNTYNNYKTNQSKTFTLAEDTEVWFNLVGCGKYDNLKYSVQVEKGSKATSYEPYNIKRYIINLNEPLRSIGDYVDYIDFKKQMVVRNVEEVDGELKGLSQPNTERISLPSILLNEGINNIQVNTNVAPSKIDMIYYTK